MQVFFLLFVLCDSQYAYYPQICPLLSENLKVCSGTTSTFTLQAADPLNSNYVCTTSTSPESCTFVRLYASSTTDNLSITSSGVITYTPVSGDSSKTFVIGVYDNNAMSADYNFPYYNMVSIYNLQFTVTDPSSFPSVNCDSYSSSCVTGSSCATCVSLTCGQAHIGRITVPSTSDIKRFSFSLTSSAGVTVTVTSRGRFIISAVSCTSSMISWSITVTDKSTKCSKVLSYGPYTLNSAPSVNITGTFYTNSYTGFTIPVLITDSTHTYTELTVTLSPTSTFQTSSISSSKTFSITAKSGAVLSSSASVTVTVTDNGVGGSNIMTSSVTITISQISLVSVTSQYVYQHSGVWTYSPSYSFSSISYYLSITTTATGLYLMNNQTGRVVWEESYINAKTVKDTYTVGYSIINTASTYTASSASSTLTLTVIAPPVIEAMDTVVSYYNCPAITSLTIVYYDFTALTFTYTGFSPITTKTSTTASISYAMPSSGNTSYKVTVTTATYKFKTFTSTINIDTLLYAYSSPVLTLAHIIAVSTSSFSIDLKHYTTFTLKNLLSYSLTDSVFAITIAGLLTATSASLATVLSSQTMYTKNLSISISNSCGSTVSLAFTVYIVSKSPSIDFTSSSFQCLEETTCTFGLSTYVNTNGLSITSYSFTNLPTSGTILTSENSITWTPPSTFSSSGDITYSVVIFDTTYSATFYITVYKQPLLLPPRMQDYSLAIGSSWSYIVQYFSYYGNSLTCICTVSNDYATNPVYDDSSNTLTWSSVTNVLSNTTSVSDFAAAFECYETGRPSTVTVSLSISLPFLTKCTIGTVSVTTAKVEVEWSIILSVTYHNSFSKIHFGYSTGPGGLSVELQSNIGSNYEYSLKWTPISTGSQSITLECTENFASYPDLSNTSTFSISVSNSDPAFTNDCSGTQAIIGENYLCSLSVTSTSSCAVDMTTYGITAIYSNNICEIAWNSTDIDSYGINSLTVVVTITGPFGKSTSLTVVLYPNDRPELFPINSTYSVPLGLVVFSLQLEVTDSESLVYSLTTGPTGLSLSTSGLIAYTTPLAGTVPVSESVIITVTDTHIYPLSITVSFAIESISILDITTPACPTSSSIIVDTQWEYTVVVPPDHVFTYLNFPGTVNSGNLMYLTATSTTQILGIELIFAYSNSQRSCTFNLYPNHLPVITAASDFSQANSANFYYRVVYSDADDNIDSLTLVLSNEPNGMVLLDAFGLVYWPSTSMSIGATSFLITVTDTGTPAASVSQTFNINVYLPSQPPKFTKPKMTEESLIKQYIVKTGYTQGTSTTINVQVSDSDTALSDLSVVIDSGFNPCGLTITQSSTDLSKYFIEWNPSYLQITSGVIKVTVFDTNQPSSSNFFELIIYNVTPIDFPPIFIGTLPTLSISEYEETAFDIFYQDLDSKLTSITVSISSSEGLVFKGKDAIYRPASHISSGTSGNYIITICSTLVSSCTSETGTVTVNIINTVPELSIAGNTVFLFNEIGEYTTVWELESTDIDGDTVIYCTSLSAGTGNIAIVGNKLYWSGVGYFDPYAIINVMVTDDGNCSNSDLKVTQIGFCIQYYCTLVFTDSLTFTLVNDRIEITGLESGLNIYVLSRISTCVYISGSTYSCTIPSNIQLYLPVIFIKNDYGLSFPYITSLNNQIFSSTSISISPVSGLGLANEVLTITLVPELQLDFLCYVQSSTTLTVYKGILYNNAYTEYYCVLPELQIGSYYVVLTEPYGQISFSYSAYTVNGIPTMTQPSVFEGHDYGGYSKSIIVNLKSWASSVYISFNYYQIQLATKTSSSTISIIIPPRYNSTTSTATLYISPTVNPYSWSNSTITFAYTGDCSVSGYYCTGSEVLECPIGYYCPNLILFSPVPCPAGFYQDELGQTTCKECGVGYMCKSDAMTSMETCEAGFICDRKSVSTPMVMCPPGYYCEEGTNTQVVNNSANYYVARAANISTTVDHWITRGTYSLSDNSFNLVPFTPECISKYFTGFVTPSVSVPPMLCPSGTYCLLATKSSITEIDSFYTPQVCTSGYTCNTGDGESFDNSNTCSAGSFCPGAGYTGVICANDTASCTVCLCPSGYSCPYQSLTVPTICSTGTYQDECGQAACQSCTAGYYCDATGLTSPVGLCPVGYMCPLGTSSSKPCSTGTYNDLTGQSECTQCPVGFYCPSQSMTAPNACNSGYICNALGMSMQLACPEGYYCPSGTNSAETGTCADGDSCPQPCSIGYQCPAASSEPTSCDLGYYQSLPAQASCSQCVPGYYCPGIGLTEMVKCPAGSYCSSYSLSDTSGTCPGGYYCLEGTASETSTFSRRLVVFQCETTSILEFYGGVFPSEPIPCPPGTYCPSGTSSGTIGDTYGPKYCITGTYADKCAVEDCYECETGYSCVGEGIIDPVLCKPGTYRSGMLVLECQSCPIGTWSGGKQGLGTSDDCSSCPEAYLCSTEGIYSYDSMQICTAGFFCPSGTSALTNYCPAGYMCPPGLSDKNSTMYPCFAGFICSTGTGISIDMLNTCDTDPSQCIVGSKCGRGYFCPGSTSELGIQCPTGTYSNEGSTNIYDCFADNTEATIFNTVNIVDQSGVSEELSVEPLSYTIYSFNFSNFPTGNNPDDYVVVLNVKGDTDYKIPFVQIGDYSPVYRLPLANSYSEGLSAKNSTLEIAILAHKSVSLTFTVEFLNGIFNYEVLMEKFLDSVVFVSTQYSTRYNKNSFIAVLNRNSQSDFKQPVNLAIHQILPSSAKDYSLDTQTLIDSVSVSILSGIDWPTTNIYPQTTFDFWSSLQYTQKLYPLDYLPYITDCEGYGAYVPLYLLFASDKCDLISSDSTTSVSILTPLKTPVGDYCKYDLTCKTSEKVTTTDVLGLWFDSYELSSSKLFYLSRKQFAMFSYESSIPNLSSGQNSFSTNYFGSSGIIGVSSIRTASSYSLGMVPKKVRLYVGYYQKNKIDKEILQAIMYFEDFTSDLNDRSYKFTFEMEALPWKQCLDLFAFDEYLYYVFVILVCLVISGIVITFWAVNYIFSTILPRPSLKLKLYLNYSLRAIKGINMIAVPTFGLIFSCSYILSSISLLQSIPGSYYDNEPIDPTSTNDSTRITKYQSGRLATCISIIGFYMIFKASGLLFAQAQIAENPREVPRLNNEAKRLRGLYLWSLVPVLMFTLMIYQFAKSEQYLSLQTLYIFLFKLANTRIVEMNRVLFNDELYVLTFYGAMSLIVMLVTIKVGAFTAFLTGYLTNIFIKIAKRTFLEPYRIEIKNKILKWKQKFKLGGSSDPASALGFKDRIYVEQINDLGANSVESIAAWLFPMLIVFNYFFYSELQLEIAKDFLKYFIVFCFLQAFADIAYDIFLNNAIECRTGRLLSEKIIELKSIYENRKCLWALSDKSPHSGKDLVDSLVNLLRLGFSTQYFFLMTTGILGIVLQIYAVELWVIWAYNPFDDPAAVFMIICLIFICFAIERVMIWTGKALKMWKLKASKFEVDLDLYATIKLHLKKVLEDQPTLRKEDILCSAFAEVVLECYDKEGNEKKRKGNIIKFLEDIEKEISNAGIKVSPENVDIDSLPLPKIRERGNQRIMKTRKKIEVTPLKSFGKWPSQLIYPWSN